MKVPRRKAVLLALLCLLTLLGVSRGAITPFQIDASREEPVTRQLTVTGPFAGEPVQFTVSNVVASRVVEPAPEQFVSLTLDGQLTIDPVNVDLQMAFNIFIIIDFGNSSNTFDSGTVQVIVPQALRPPSFDMDIYNFTVPENAFDGYTIGRLAVTIETSSSVEYLVDQEATREDGVRIATIFSFTSNTPNLIVSDSNQLNREERDQYRFNVIVSNEEGSDTAEVNVVLYLTDANDNDPNITNSGATALISETDVNGTFVLQVEAMDDDQMGTPNADIRFSLLGDVPFGIDAVSGNITVNGTLSARQYNITVIARDLGVPARMGMGYFLIDVAPANEHAPQFVAAPYTVNVLENTFPVDPVLTFTVSDSSTGDEALVEILDLEGPDADSFYLNVVYMQPNGSVGELFLNGTLDREEQDILVVTLIARDSGIEQFRLTSSTNVKLTVDDVNDNTPYFTSQLDPVVLVSENASVGQAVFLFAAMDDDIGTNAKLSFTVEGSSDFVLDEESGNLTVAITLTKSRQENYTLLVTVSDSGGRNTSTNITIFVTEVNDNPNDPNITNSGYAEQPTSDLLLIVTIASSVGGVVLLLAAVIVVLVVCCCCCYYCGCCKRHNNAEPMRKESVKKRFSNWTMHYRGSHPTIVEDDVAHDNLNYMSLLPVGPESVYTSPGKDMPLYASLARAEVNNSLAAEGIANSGEVKDYYYIQQPASIPEKKVSSVSASSASPFLPPPNRVKSWFQSSLASRELPPIPDVYGGTVTDSLEPTEDYLQLISAASPPVAGKQEVIDSYVDANLELELPEEKGVGKEPVAAGEMHYTNEDVGPQRSHSAVGRQPTYDKVYVNEEVEPQNGHLPVSRQPTYENAESAPSRPVLQHQATSEEDYVVMMT